MLDILFKEERANMIRDIGLLQQYGLIVDESQPFYINDMFILLGIELNIKVIDRHHDSTCKDISGEIEFFFIQEFSEVCEHGKTFRYCIFIDEGTFALLTFEIALSDQFQDCGSDSGPAYIEHFTDILFSGDLRSNRPFAAFNLFLNYLVELLIKFLMVIPVY
jgi:hypothetical protein